jgi:hypothetical protein
MSAYAKPEAPRPSEGFVTLYAGSTGLRSAPARPTGIGLSPHWPNSPPPGPVSVHALVLMTNQVHQRMRPDTERRVSRLMKGLGRR